MNSVMGPAKKNVNVDYRNSQTHAKSDQRNKAERIKEWPCLIIVASDGTNPFNLNLFLHISWIL